MNKKIAAPAAKKPAKPAVVVVPKKDGPTKKSITATVPAKKGK